MGIIGERVSVSGCYWILFFERRRLKRHFEKRGNKKIVINFDVVE